MVSGDALSGTNQGWGVFLCFVVVVFFGGASLLLCGITIVTPNYPYTSPALGQKMCTCLDKAYLYLQSFVLKKVVVLFVLLCAL